jgi:hypothetical protein
MGWMTPSAFSGWPVFLYWVCRIAYRRAWRFNSAMPALTRHRNLEAPDECWHVYYGDVRVGTIALRTRIPHHEDPWGWACGFYPGSHPRECTDGTASKPAPILKRRGWSFCQTELRQISRLGAIKGIGQPRSIAASIGTNACRRIGNRHNGALVADPRASYRITKYYAGNVGTSVIGVDRSRAPCFDFIVSSFRNAHQNVNNRRPNLTALHTKSENRKTRFAIMALTRTKSAWAV